MLLFTRTRVELPLAWMMIRFLFVLRHLAVSKCEDSVTFPVLFLKFFVDFDKFRKMVDNVRKQRPTSVFSQRTEESSASQYFQFYGYLSQQQNMMQDYVRTSTYQKAILGNSLDFHVSYKKNPIKFQVKVGFYCQRNCAVQGGS